MKNNLLFLIIFIGIVVCFFKDAIFYQKVPIPADTIVGLYHPFRDYYAPSYPRGIPFKNFLITDPVRQQYVWRKLSIDSFKKIEMPIWNPYSMGGYPLIGNLQSGAFYPFNIIFFLLPFTFAWTILVILQQLLAGIFMFFFLRNLRLSREACLIGVIAFTFSGFVIAWLEWNTIIHVLLWLPLLLLAIDKLTKKFRIRWFIALLFGVCSSFFAGHLQVFFYVSCFTLCYFVSRYGYMIRIHRKLTGKYICYMILSILVCSAVTGVITFLQWFPTLQLVNLSSRTVDQSNWQQTQGWFIPWQHLIQFFIPDFFGNPSTLNYWGTWNYGELVGYIGIIPIIFSLFATIFRRDKKTYFFTSMVVICFLFSLPTFIATVPFLLHIPLLSTSQPTRLLSVIVFCLAVLSALGFDFLKEKKRELLYSVAFVITIFIAVWIIFLLNPLTHIIALKDIIVVRQNVLFSTALLTVSSISILLYTFSKTAKYKLIFYWVLILIIAADVMRFGFKFTPFTDKKYLYPSTQTTNYLQKNQGQFRIMSIDDSILPPNFSAMYHLFDIGGYDPLYIARYADLLASLESEQDKMGQNHFKRIITVKKYNSPLINLLGVKYILSLSDISGAGFIKVFQEGETKIFENKHVLPRAFFLSHIQPMNNDHEILQTMLDSQFPFNTRGLVNRQDTKGTKIASSFSLGRVTITDYTPNKVIIKTSNKGEGFLILTDIYYPVWKVKMYSSQGKEVSSTYNRIYRVDHAFRGIVIPKGDYIIYLYNQLL